MADAKGLYPKLAEAIAEVDRVGKDGVNAHHKYKYTSAEAIYKVIRKPLLDRGLIVIPSIPVSLREGTLTTASLHLKIIDTESGESLEADWVGEGSDKNDKAVFKAATGGMKTWLRHLFMLPADDDPEADSAMDRAMTAMERLEVAGDRNGLTFDERQEIGKWMHPGGQLDESRLHVAVAKLEAGETGALAEIVSRA